MRGWKTTDSGSETKVLQELEREREKEEVFDDERE